MPIGHSGGQQHALCPVSSWSLCGFAGIGAVCAMQCGLVQSSSEKFSLHPVLHWQVRIQGRWAVSEIRLFGLPVRHLPGCAGGIWRRFLPLLSFRVHNSSRRPGVEHGLSSMSPWTVRSARSWLPAQWRRKWQHDDLYTLSCRKVFRRRGRSVLRMVSDRQVRTWGQVPMHRLSHWHNNERHGRGLDRDVPKMSCRDVSQRLG